MAENMGLKESAEVNSVERFLATSDNDQDVAPLTRELQQTKTQLDDQNKDIRVLACAVSELNLGTRMKGEVLRQVTEKREELKTTVDAFADKLKLKPNDISQQTNERQHKSIAERENIMAWIDEEISQIKAKLEMTVKEMEQRDINKEECLRKVETAAAQQSAIYETKLSKQQEQMVHLQAQIDALISTHKSSLPICDKLREDVDKIDKKLHKIDDAFFPDSSAAGMIPPCDGVDEQPTDDCLRGLPCSQPATNA